MTHTILGVIVLAILAPVAFTLFIARRVTKGFPPEGKLIDIGGDRVHYIDHGTDPAIAFAYGLCGNLRDFAYLDPDRLARSYRVIVIDQPGAGQSVRGGNSFASVYAQVRMVAQCIEQLGLDKPVLVGYSFGRAISLVVELNHPHVTHRLALIAPLTRAESTPPGASRGLVLTSPPVRRPVSWTLATLLLTTNSYEAIAMVLTPETMPKNFPFKRGGLLGLRLHVFYAASSDLVAAPEDLPDMERRYASMIMPVDVLYGRGDRILNVKRQGEVLGQKLDRVNLCIIDGGHMLPVTQPVLTTGWVLAVAAGVPVETEAPA